MPESKPALSLALDVVTIDRSSVDLYGEEVGGRLGDMSSFTKYAGGCPTNIAIGTARPGLRSGLLIVVGRSIPGEAARDGLEGRIDGATAPDRMAGIYGRLIAAWDSAHAGGAR